ncbi:hypothetical protein JAAARDRAFT_365202 [Jaapia argillacea MUCL 33604]|uniref:Uncharacterized protein n=1 Tax=Jaapia argillacea MUCL 33604 TaxID=933084 RepID=A0A067Q7X2_9AGAM|nr:hypothetical protein JAAARDRAFT_365202 [Jaapia argillacea MUCL 33604]
MFRVSPWISYDPSRNDEQQPETSRQGSDTMDDDIDMDAPLISTLREEDSPAPESTPASVRTSKFRVKLLVNKRPGPSSSPAKSGVESEEEEEEEEEEEDQLIDDDDELLLNPSHAPVSANSPVKGIPKRKSAPKKPKKEKAPVDHKRTKGLAEKQVPDKLTGPGVDPGQHVHASEQEIASLNPPTPARRKKGQGTTRTAVVRSHPQQVELQAKSHGLPVVKKLPVSHTFDTENLSEAEPGTGASSPVHHHDDELESVGPSAPPAPSVEEFAFENVPLPIYPLPSKPFPVQPPVKIGSGFAPVLPLDKTGKKVRHWRLANREIRGIAGGRWFVHSWVGDKESDYAASTAAAIAEKQAASQAMTPGDKAAPAVTIPSLPPLSISAPPLGKPLVKPKIGVNEYPTSISALSMSRPGSVVPEKHLPRAPTKMRTTVAAESREGSPSDTARMEVDGLSSHV